MKVRTRIPLIGTIAVALIAVAILSAALVTGSDLFRDSESQPTDAQSPELALRYPADGSAESSIHLLSWEELVADSDVVVVARIRDQGEYRREATGITDTTGVSATYTVEAQQYLKGSSPDTLDLQVPVAYEMDDVESAYQIQDGSPLDVGSTYVLALRSWNDSWAPTGEPFRFRVEDGIATVESTVTEVAADPFLGDTFSPRPLEDLVADVETLLSNEARPLH